MSCPSCSRGVPVDSTFCPWCGASMSLGVCPSCGVKAPEGARFCLNCGKSLAVQEKAMISAPRVAEKAEAKPSVAPGQNFPVVTIESVQDSSFRPLTAEEINALKQAASWEKTLAQVVGFVTIFWGVIGFFAPVDLIKFGLIGLVPGIFGVMAGLATRQKVATANIAIANGRAVEFTGVSRAEGKNVRRIDVDGGNIKFVAQRIPKALDDATRGDGAQVKVTFTEGGSEVPAATETMILAVNGAALPKPVLGQVVVTR